MKSVKDFDHIQRGKKTEIADKQQPREQNKKLEIENCKYCAATHKQKQ